ncbi:MAG: RNA polymerase sigma factor [Myxococcaceae bacterium]
MSPSDTELIARVLANDDRHAFGELVRRYQSEVRGMLRRLTGDAAAADDLAQETFLRAHRSLGQYRGGAKLSCWLYRIAYNAFISQARRSPPPMAYEAPVSASMDHVLSRHDLMRAMAELRPDERAALALTYGQDVSHEEAARILDWPLGTLKTNVLRAKDKLRERLAAKEAAS